MEGGGDYFGDIQLVQLQVKTHLEEEKKKWR